MRLLFCFILGIILFSCRGLAQEEDNVTTATFALQQVLSTLKESVDKLNMDNDQLTAQDESIKQQVIQLQGQLGNVENQGNDLNKAADKLREENPRRDEQISRLQEENSALDNRIQLTQSGMNAVQQSLDEGYQEDQKLLLQLKAMTNVPTPLPQATSPMSQIDADRQKEKLKLIKMTYESQQRQETLHGAILEFQEKTPLLPAASVLAQQQILKVQVKDLEAQIAEYPPDKLSNSGAGDQWNDEQLSELEEELKALERNYSQLKDLTGQMGQKAQSVSMTVSQKVEGDKLQGSVDDLTRKGETLRADLDDLRSELIELDKRKSRLEMMVQQM